MIGSRSRGVAIALVTLCALTLVLAGCLPSTAVTTDFYPQSALAPESDFAEDLQILFDLIFWIAAVVFVVVEGALIYAVIRFREKPGQGLPPQLHGNTRLEVTWTIIPVFILAIIAVPTVSTIFRVAADPKPDALHVRVVGHQWWWEFEYPDLGIVTANELHVPVGRQVAISLESADVIHSFWFPRMGGKRDVVPNTVNNLWFTPQRTGEYLGQCGEFCGESHANMHMRLFVETPGDFDAWVRNQEMEAVEDLTPQVREGAKIFVQRGCVVCHTIGGTDAQGKLGPDLTHFGSRTTLASGILSNVGTQDLKKWLRDPPAIKPGSKMPNLDLSESDVNALTAYLHSLK